MKIQYISDLHLEFKENEDYFAVNNVNAYGEVLIIAGDTINLVDCWMRNILFDKLSNNFEQVYIIPGNHEFYGNSLITLYNDINFELEIRKNVHLVNNSVIEYNGVRFVFSTLWSRITNNKNAILCGMADFSQIKIDNELLTIETYNSLFEKCWSFLKKELEKETKLPTVVVTHHLPSKECNLPKFQNTILNEGFCTDLTQDIIETEPNYWIYGHSHGNKPPFKIGKTTMLTNQFGYIRFGRSAGFNLNSVIEID